MKQPDIILGNETDGPPPGPGNSVDAEGNWTLDLGALPAGRDPSADYVVTGWCMTNSPDVGEDNLVGIYDRVPFDVTGPATTETTQPVPTAPMVMPAAPPATLVEGEPTFTG